MDKICKLTSAGDCFHKLTVLPVKNGPKTLVHHVLQENTKTKLHKTVAKIAALASTVTNYHKVQTQAVRTVTKDITAQVAPLASLVGLANTVTRPLGLLPTNANHALRGGTVIAAPLKQPLQFVRPARSDITAQEAPLTKLVWLANTVTNHH